MSAGRCPFPTPGGVTGAARPARPSRSPGQAYRALSPEAKAEWRRVVPELEEMGVLATVDRAVLIRYCTAWADWVELQELLSKSGKLIRGQKGNLVRNPLLLVRKDVEATLSDLGRQLGLSPGARLRADIAHERPTPDETPAGVMAIEEYRRRLGA